VRACCKLIIYTICNVYNDYPRPCFVICFYVEHRIGHLPGPWSWAVEICGNVEICWNMWKYIAWIMLKPIVIPRDPIRLTCDMLILCEHMWAQWSQISGIASPASCRVISLNRKVNHTRRSWKHALPTSQTVHRPVVYQHAHKMRLGTRTNQGLTKGEMTTKRNWLTFAFLQQVKSSEKCPANPSKCTKFPQEFLSKQKMI